MNSYSKPHHLYELHLLRAQLTTIYFPPPKSTPFPALSSLSHASFSPLSPPPFGPRIVRLLWHVVNTGHKLCTKVLSYKLYYGSSPVGHSIRLVGVTEGARMKSRNRDWWSGYNSEKKKHLATVKALYNHTFKNGGFKFIWRSNYRHWVHNVHGIIKLIKHKIYVLSF